MTRGVAHPPELRAQVIAAVGSGRTLSDVAAQFGIDKSVVSRWVGPEMQRLATDKKKAVLEQLILEYWVTGMRALIVQAEVYADEHYCRSQDADKLAIAHGVVGDKLALLASTAKTLGLGPQGTGGDEQAALDAASAPPGTT